MKPEYEAKISSYLDNKMNDQERQAFEEACQKDTALKEALKLELKARMAIQVYARKERQTFYEKTALFDQVEKKSQSVFLGKPFKMAASVLVICAIGYIVYQYAQPVSPQKTFEKQFRLYVVPTERGQLSDSINPVDSLWYAASLFYQKQEWERSERLLLHLKGQEGFMFNDVSQLMLANIALEQDQPKKALEILLQMERNNLTLGFDISWYLGLTYLKLEDKASAIEVLTPLIKKSKVYGQRAKDIIDQL
ncbi:hypothetical protein FNH22_00550 [Fulvivirga sp. M361]|uniref:hypothetical protein n=1 Tax=Fulvivirga sp. M361 TaxID=2594266 RepID=UPI001179B492|nr:hypothetical protein [Fulvivirga sp. M361]TRX62617.1 hypothetical protein FNH22_00550 [Fulvivirga sp. M361]